MQQKLSPKKKRSQMILVPVNAAEKRAIRTLASQRGVSAAHILRDLVRRECQAVREAKKTKAA